MIFTSNDQYLEKARAHLADVRKLPALPTTATEIVDSLSDEFVTLEKVAEILERDPSITARILSLANSAYYGQSGSISTVREAIVRVVGLDLTRGVALGIALGSTFDTSLCPNFDLPGFWQTSLYTAVINSAICKEIDCTESEQKLAFAAGLISQIGILTLAAVEPEKLEEALQQTTKSGQDEQGIRLSEALGNILEFDDHTAGIALAELWVLPYPLIDSLSKIGQPYESMEDEDLLAVATNFSLGVANILLGKASNDEEMEKIYAQLGIKKKLSEILHGIDRELHGMDMVVSQMS